MIMVVILIVAGILFIIGEERYGDKVLYLLRIVIVSVIVLIIVYLILFLFGAVSLNDLRRLLTVILPKLS